MYYNTKKNNTKIFGQTELMKLILKFPNNSWDWDSLSQNPNITLLFIDMTPYLFWDFAYVSYNPNLDMYYILNNLHKDWNWSGISCNPGITLWDIKSYPNLPWEYNFISRNPNININYILNNIEKNWDWYEISLNPSITLEDIDIYNHLPWDWKNILTRSDITLDFVLKYENKFNIPTNIHEQYLSQIFGRSIRSETRVRREIFETIGSSPCITLENIQRYSYLFSQKQLSKNPNVTLEYIFSHLLGSSWNWMDIGARITLQDFVLHEEQFAKLDFMSSYDFMRGFSQNPNVTYSFVVNNPRYKWHWYNLCINPSMMPVDLFQNTDLLQHYTTGEWLSRNPNLTAKDIIDNPNIHWYWNTLSRNEFLYNKEILIKI